MIKGLRNVPVQLPAQHVVVAGRRGGVADLHVVLGIELEKALQPRRGMLRPLPLIAMRQQADEAGHAQPLALARADELVEIDLGAIGEIAELRLPQGQAVGVGQAVAVFVAEHALFGEHGCRSTSKSATVAHHRLQRRVALLGVLVVDQGMALAEGAAADVLAREPDREPLVQQACAKASCSAVAQSMPLPVSIAWRRWPITRFSRGWTFRLSGSVVTLRPSSRRRSSVHAGLAALVGLGCPLAGPFQAPSSQSALLVL